MSGQDFTEPRLRRTGFGRVVTRSGARGHRYDGLTLEDFQKRALRQAFDERWPHDTARAAARDLAEPHQTVRNWLEGLAFPSGFKLLKLQRHLGLAFLARLDPDPDSALRVALAVIERQALEAEFARLAARLSDGRDGAA